MKIAYITNATERSGVGLRAIRIKELLEKREGVKVDEYYINGSELKLFKNNKEIVGLKKWPGAFNNKTIGWIRLAKFVRREIEKESYGLVHVTNQTLSFIPRGNVPFVVTVHDIIELVEPQTRLGGLAARYLYGGIGRANKIIAVSQFTADMVRAKYGLSKEKVEVIYNGVSKELNAITGFGETVAGRMLQQELKLTDDSKVVLYVGSDHPRKNVLAAIRAFAGLARKNKNYIFIKVGEPGIAVGREKLLAEIDNFGVRGAVRFVGGVSNEKLNDLYNLADVLVYPSKFEGFGLPPLQAMACGTPVITSNASSIPEVVGDAAVMLDPDDVDGIEKSIERVLNDSKTANGLKARGLRQAQKFTWEKAAADVARIYKV